MMFVPFGLFIVILLLVLLIVVGRMTPANAVVVFICFLLILWLFGLVGAR